MRAHSSLGRLAALAALSVPVLAGVLLLTPGRALADDSPSTITCPKGGSAGGGTVTGTGHSCGTYGRDNALVVTATVSCTSSAVLGIQQCSQTDPTFVVTSPTGSQLTRQAVAPGKQATYTVPAGAPAGTYTASLSGGGADVTATLQLVDPAPAASTPAQQPGGTGSGSAASPAGGSTSGTAGSGSAGPGTAGAGGGASAPPPGAPAPGVTGTGDVGVIPFPDVAPPAGLAALAPLPTFPAPGTSEPTDPGTYGTTLPYSGSVPVAAKAAAPSLLGSVAGSTVGNRQLVEAVAAAALALLGAAHLRRLARHGMRDGDL